MYSTERRSVRIGMQPISHLSTREVVMTLVGDMVVSWARNFFMTQRHAKIFYVS